MKIKYALMGIVGKAFMVKPVEPARPGTKHLYNLDVGLAMLWDSASVAFAYKEANVMKDVIVVAVRLEMRAL